MTKLRGEVDGVPWSYDLEPGERAAIWADAVLVITHPDRAVRFLRLPGMTETPLALSAEPVVIESTALGVMWPMKWPP